MCFPGSYRGSSERTAFRQRKTYLRPSFGLPLGNLCWRRIKQVDKGFGQPCHVPCLIHRDISEEVRMCPGVAIQPNVVNPAADGCSESPVINHLLDLVFEITLCLR